MSGFHILAPTWVAGATATSNDDANVQLAASNLTSVQYTRYWQTGSPDGIQLTLDAGEARAWNTIVLLYNNGYDGTAFFKSNASTGTLFSGPSFNSGSQDIVLPGGAFAFQYHHTWYAADTTQTHRYIGIEIDDTDNPEGFFSAGVVMAGVRFMPRIGADLGSRRGYDDPSVAVEMVSGETIVRPKRSKMTGNWVFPYQSEADTMQWDYLMRTFGKKIPLVFKWEPRDNAIYQQQTLFYGFAQWGNITYVHAHGMWTVEVGMKEL